MADPTPGTIPALPPLVGSLGTGALFEISNSGVSQSVTSDQIAAFAVGPDAPVPETRTISTPDSGGLSGGGTLASNLTLSMNPNVLNSKTVPVAADSVVINDSSGNTPAKTTLSDFYKSIAGLSHQMAPVPTTYSIVLYDSADGNTYQSTLQDAFVVSGTLPVGGTTGQALVKSSDADFETEWSNSTGSVTSVTVSAGTGLSGGGTITSAGTITLALANTAVTAASYGSSSASPTFTVDAQGRLTSAANATITPTAIGAVPTTRTITAGTGLTGGGDLSANRTLAIDVTGVSAATYGDSTHVSQVAVNTQGQITSASSVAISLASLGAVPTSRTLTAGTGLTGGGTLAADRTFTLADTAVTPGSYGTASTVGTFTVDQQGRITAATPTTITPAAIGAVPTTRAVNTATGLTGGGALSSDLTINYNITALANKASPSSVSDLVLIWDAAASAYKNATVGSIASGGTVSSFNTRTGAVVSASGDYSLAQLAMTTGSRILATDASGVSGASAITFASSNAGFPGTIAGVDTISVTDAVNPVFKITNTGSGGGSFAIFATNAANPPGGSIAIYDYTASTSRFWISSTGNVGIGTTVPVSTLDIAGSLGTTIATFTSNTTLTASQHTLLGNAVSGAFTFTLPAASGCAGREYVIKKIDTTANAVTINVSGGGTIDGDTSVQLTTQYQSIEVQSDGSSWWVVGSESTVGNFATRAAVVAAIIPSTLTYLSIAGYYAAGDGGAALYKKVGSQPTHAGKIQSADGAWWELAEDYPNVLMFGAKGDNSTNDATAIQNSIDYIQSFPYGGSLIFPPGRTYYIGSTQISVPVMLNKAAKLFGYGAGLRGDLSSSAYMIYAGQPSDTIPAPQFVLKGLKFEGNNGIYMQWWGNCLIEDGYFLVMKIGIVLDNNYSSQIRRNLFRDFQSSGLGVVAITSTNHLLLEGNSFYNIYNPVLLEEFTYNINIINNDFEGGVTAISVPPGGSSLNIDGNYIEGFTGLPVYFGAASNGISFRGNWMNNPSTQEWANIDGGVIETNTFYNQQSLVDASCKNIDIGHNSFINGSNVIVSPLTAPTLLNGFTHVSGLSAVGYRKTANGDVHLQGGVSAASDNLAFVLPAGYIPAAIVQQSVPGTGQTTGTTPGLVQINSFGSVTVYRAPDGTACLDGITFLAGA